MFRSSRTTEPCVKPSCALWQSVRNRHWADDNAERDALDMLRSGRVKEPCVKPSCALCGRVSGTCAGQTIAQSCWPSASETRSTSSAAAAQRSLCRPLRGYAHSRTCRLRYGLAFTGLQVRVPPSVHRPGGYGAAGVHTPAGYCAGTACPTHQQQPFPCCKACPEDAVPSGLCMTGQACIYILAQHTMVTEHQRSAVAPTALPCTCSAFSCTQ